MNAVVLRPSSCTPALTPVWFSLPQRSVRSTRPVRTVFWLETRTAPGTPAPPPVLIFSRMMLKDGEKWELTSVVTDCTSVLLTMRISFVNFSNICRHCVSTLGFKEEHVMMSFSLICWFIIWPCSVSKTLLNRIYFIYSIYLNIFSTRWHYHLQSDVSIFTLSCVFTVCFYRKLIQSLRGDAGICPSGV